MWLWRNLLLVTLATFPHLSYGCQLDGVTNWFVPVSRQIQDVYRGSIFSGSTTNIVAISNINYGEGMNGGPYFTPTHNNDSFDISTNAAYENYEENEIITSMTITVTFQCTGGSSQSVVFIIGITDTNNNAPQFRPTDEYDFTIATPIPPGFQITGCVNDIIVRDIDLTTQRINFEIEENSFFEIAYDAAASTVSKEFKAVLRTTALIRALPEVVELKIYATDVDLTGDPPITTSAIIRIQGDAEFELPAEPIFSQPFYLASYTASHEIVLEQLISLQQGYHENVTFTLEGDYKDNFELVSGINQMTLNVTTPLSNNTLRTERVILVVRAEREYTSGATATIIVQPPEVLGLEFSQLQYEGSIVDNVLQPLELTLVNGYQDGVNVIITGDYSSYFYYTVQGSSILLTMTSLDTSIVAGNNFITLEVIASNEYSSATTIVTLAMIKDDINTPAFENAIYSGTFDLAAGLTLEQIVLVQGYDDNVNFELEGEHKDYFEIERDRNYVNLTVSTLPIEVLIEQYILLTIRATKPRTVDATTTVSISLPEARELQFEASAYSGTLQDNDLTLENIILSIGHADDVNFTLAGEYASSFAVVPIENQITINLTTALPGNVVTENSLIILTLTASGVHAVTTSTSIVLEIIKQDITTPVFSEHIYRVEYSGNLSIDLKSTSITLIQGFDNDVLFRLDGEQSDYFNISGSNENDIKLSLKSEIPEELIYQEKVLVFNIMAEKALTVGANAAVLIEFPRELTEAREMRFAQQTYIGSLQDANFTLENIVLETGYAPGTQFTLLGEYASYFTTIYTNNIITVSLNISMSLPTEVLEKDTIIVLELEAQRERALTVVTSIVIEVLREQIIVPEFSNAYYRGTYTESEEFIFHDTIYLSQGYNETVTFKLEGDFSTWFDVVPQSDSVNLILTTPIPEEVLESNNQLLFTIVAIKSNTIDGRAAISIDLPKETLNPILLSFTQTSYVGHIQSNELIMPNIILLSHNLNTTLNITGEFASFFKLLQDNSNITVQLNQELPPDIIEENAFVVLDITASHPEAVTGYTTLVIEIAETEIVLPIFEQAYYTGEYSEQDGLMFEHSIRLIQGFDESVSFTLSGDDAQWFELVNNESFLSLRLTNDTIKEVKDRSHLVFSVVASKANSVPGQTAIIISLTDFYSIDRLIFTQNYYLGSIEDGTLNMDQIVLEKGYTSDINVTLSGDHLEYFQLTHQEGIFTLQLQSDLPANIIDTKKVLIISIQVETGRERTHATVILELIKPDITLLGFDEIFYVGSYSEIQGFIFESQIILASGYDETVSFSLNGDSSQWFKAVVSNNTVSLIVPTPIPTEVLVNNQQLIFVIKAEKEESATTASATIVVEVVNDTIDLSILSFTRFSYLGSITDNEVEIETIKLIGYTENVTYELRGELQSYFNLSYDGPNVTIVLQNDLTEEIIPENRIILLELQAVAPQSITAHATIVFEVKIAHIIAPIFEQTYYVGQYSASDGLIFENPIKLSEGYDESVIFTIDGEGTQWIRPVIFGNSVTLNLTDPIPQDVMENNHHLVLIVTAQKSGTNNVTSTIVISLREYDIQLAFAETYYTGTYTEEEGLVFESTIFLTVGYDENVEFTLEGDGTQWFDILVSENENSVTLINTNPVPPATIVNNQQLILILHANRPGSSSARATIVISLENDLVNASILGFDRNTYIGSIENNVSAVEMITLSEGYTDQVTFTLIGELSTYFNYTRNNASITVSLVNGIPDTSIPENEIILIEVRASAPDTISAHAVIVFKVIIDSTTSQLQFNEAYYTGRYNQTQGLIFEDIISIAQGYNSDVVFDLEGDNSQWFGITKNGNSVSLILTTPIPSAVTFNNRKLIFVIRAQKPDSITARATIVISLMDEFTDGLVFGFDKITYVGSFENNITTLEPITLSEGFSEDVDVTFTLYGALSEYFTRNINGTSVTLSTLNGIPDESIPNNGIIVLELQASASETLSAFAAIVIEVVKSTKMVFSEVYYIGNYTETGFNFETTISLVEGYDDTVQFTLGGAITQYFDIETNSNSAKLISISPIPSNIVANNQFLTDFVLAQKNSGDSAKAAIIVALTNDTQTEDSVHFEKILYEGVIAEGLVQHEPISVLGYEGTYIQILGEHSTLFEASLSDGNVIVRGADLTNLSSDVSFVALELRVSGAGAILLLDVEQSETPPENISFEKSLYEGTIQDGVVQHESITVSGYSGTNIQIVGDYAELFGATLSNGTVTIQGLALENLPSNVFFVAIEMRVGGTSAVLVLTVNPMDPPPENISFEKSLYEGTIQDGVVQHESITVSGYSGTNIQIVGDYAELFGATLSNGTVTIQVLALENLPSNVFFVAIEMRVGGTSAVLVLTVNPMDPPSENVSFEKSLYEGTIQDGFIQHESITVTGYSGTNIRIAGDNEEFFIPTLSNGNVTIEGVGLENLPSDVLFVALEIRISTASAMLVLTVDQSEAPPPENVSFEKILYEGTIKDDVVEHETIMVTGYSGTDIQVTGGFSQFFEGTVSSGTVTVRGIALDSLSDDVSFVALQLRVSNATAMLVLTVHKTVTPVIPTVTFGSESYAVSVDVSQTGLAGRVSATADNREAITYSLNIDDAHLQQRLSIDSQGGLYLSAPANSGVYNFQVVATTVQSHASATAQVYLTVEAITICGEGDLVVPPLIILDRDEEEPHRNLVPLNSTQFPGCRYSLTNRWPLDQTWLYVDDNGLHSLAIDREHESIAFMALSQVQVELILECDTDKVSTRYKRSLNPQTRLDHLGPYDYGSNIWILSDSILFNSRRTLVNLIVNDINDNAPIFIGKENEPIVVCYPIPELEERVLPRALAELEATDADVGENAKIVYWSSEDALAVAPTTGFVHIRENELLEDNSVLTVNATDRNGVGGLTGSINLLVKLIDTNHIAVITIRNAFLDDEHNILSNLTEALGYEVKVLRSTVISDNTEDTPEMNTRKKRESTNASRASLQLYVYGLIEREPVDVNKLAEDISSSTVTAVNIVRTVSLEDYLEGLESCVVQSATGLLVATIVLSVLLFILIVAVTVWFFLTRRKNKTYEQFTDENSTASQNESAIQTPKPENIIVRQRLDIEALKKSERRLQELLEAPLEEITVKPTSSNPKPYLEDSHKIVVNDTPIVIQSIDKLKAADDSDDEDEFGEKMKTKRKSVVTFNENVEKIIHVEDTPDDNSSLGDFEVYKF